MTNIKANFRIWLIQSKDNKSKTTLLTANEYINRLNRLNSVAFFVEMLKLIGKIIENYPKAKSVDHSWGFAMRLFSAILFCYTFFILYCSDYFS